MTIATRDDLRALIGAKPLDGLTVEQVAVVIDEARRALKETGSRARAADAARQLAARMRKAIQSKRSG